MLKVSTFCSGIGSAEEALKNLGVEHEVMFASEIDKYARQSYDVNHDAKMMINDMCEPDYVGEQYYSDLNISGLPCQAFSLAGKRLGELDKRGVLFYDFYRWVKNQQPKVFVIENVKGLLSADKGVIFQNWCQLLGRSVNYQNHFFMHEDSLEYNLHYTVLNSKNFGVPQNRERVFIVGIRKDLPNDFRFPVGWKLDKRLRDVLETNVDEKYYLSEKMMNYLNTRKDNFNNGKINYKTGVDTACDINASSKSLDISDNIIVVNNHGNIEQRDLVNCIDANYHKGMDNHQQRSFEVQNSAVEPQLNQIAQIEGFESEGRVYDANGLARTIKDGGGGGSKTGWYAVGEDWVVGGLQKNQTPKTDGICPTLTSAMGMGGGQIPIVSDKVVQLNDSKESGGKQPYKQNRIFHGDGVSPVLDTECGRPNYLVDARIRRLLPIETFRLQGYSDEFFYKCQAVNSDTRLYQQAGNTITVSVIQAIIKNLLHILK